MTGRARLAWAVVAVTAALVVADGLMAAQYMSLWSVDALGHHGWPAVQAAALSSAVMGALIVTRLPAHPIGWLLVAGGFITPASLATEAYSDWVVLGDGPGSRHLADVVGTVSQLSNASVGLATLTLIFLLAPDGRLASRRWWVAGALAVLGPFVYDVTVLAVAPTRLSPADGNAGYSAVTMWIARSGFTLAAVALIAAVVSLLRRLRRARGVERQQLRWIVGAAGMMAAGLVLSMTASTIAPDARGFQIPFFLAYLAFPVCVAVAVLKYRLFDLDLFVNRALVLGIATGLVAAGYVLVVISLGSLVEGVWPSLLATAVVALAFQPVRRRVVRLADRLVYGESASPYEALAEFSRRLGDSPEPATLLPTVADAAGSAVGARRVTVRLLVPGGTSREATWPSGPGSVAVSASDIGVVDRGEELGSIAVDMPPGRSLRSRDGRLLRDLADQAAIAFRNARLAAELADQVAELDRRTSELAESRRRLVTVGDEERQRIERSIARDVVPHLAPLPARLEELAHDVDPAQLAPLIDAANCALEALREITRGVFPAQLARSGLASALGSHVGRLDGVVLEVDDSVAGTRFSERVEAAAYFSAIETLRELGRPASVQLSVLDGCLRLSLAGTDAGGVEAASLRDRVEAVGGTVSAVSDGAGGEIEVVLPLQAEGFAAASAAADQAAVSVAGPNADLVT